MKISICIPQYNRIQYLLRSLSIIVRQTYSDLEVVISDDASSDSTQEEIENLKSNYPHPLVYHKFETNQGYDTNLRKAIELSSGEYVIVIGNDDTINPDVNLDTLKQFLVSKNYPSIGFTNFSEENSTAVFRRAQVTNTLGSGPDIAIKYYSCFSFVGGIIFKRKDFLKYNTSKYDGSIYSQIYLACYMISMGNELFSIDYPVVIKDLRVGDARSNSYRDSLVRKWKDYRQVNGGLPSVIHVVLSALKDSGAYKSAQAFRIFSRIYFKTVPFWILDYKANQALPNAVGIIHGMFPPKVPEYKELNWHHKASIGFIYFFSSLAALTIPSSVFQRIKDRLYNYSKK